MSTNPWIIFLKKITIDIKLLHPPKHLAQSQTASAVRMKLIYGKVTVENKWVIE